MITKLRRYYCASLEQAIYPTAQTISRSEKPARVDDISFAQLESISNVSWG